MRSVEPLPMDHIEHDPQLAEIFAERLTRTGYISNSLRVMARVPGLVRSADTLVTEMFFRGEVETPLKMLMFLMFSGGWGCHYCQAHALVNVKKAGVEDDQLDALWEFPDSDRFDAREKAALSLARDAVSPDGVTEDHYRQLRKHFDDDQIIELLGMIATAAFLNTWNSSLGTELEPYPLEAATETLGHLGWTGERHRK